MKGLCLSRAAAGLMRALSACVLADHKILLTGMRSMDWQSLTFAGERHQIAINLLGPEARAAARQLVAILPEFEFAIPGHVVADIAARLVEEETIGSVSVAIEALTIAD